jgi:hypothetical protein
MEVEWREQRKGNGMSRMGTGACRMEKADNGARHGMWRTD